MSSLMGERTRLRQVALVATDLDAVVKGLETELGVRSPFHDPGVSDFGLHNAVFAVGDSFLEVVSPVRAGTTAGRYLEKRGGDSGYMAIFQVPDMAAARNRVRDLGVRVVWTADLPDMAGTHLHPKDVPGAIVSLDWARPAGSWTWGGPDWTGRVPEHGPGGILGLVIAAVEPIAVAKRWASILGVEAEVVDGEGVAGEGVDSDGDAGPAAARLTLDGGRQTVRFITCPSRETEGIAEVTVALEEPPPRPAKAVEIGGVRFVLSSPQEESG
jgi:hypothetical protein